MKKRLVILGVLVMAMLMVTATALAGKIPMVVDKSDTSVSWDEYPGYVYPYYCTGYVDVSVNGVANRPFTAYYDSNGNLAYYEVRYNELPDWAGIEGVEIGPESKSGMRLTILYKPNHSFKEVYLDRIYPLYGNNNGIAGYGTLSYEWNSSAGTWEPIGDNDWFLGDQTDPFDPKEYWAQVGGFDPTKYEIYGSWNGTSAAPSNPTPTPEKPSTPTTGSATLDNAYGKLAIVDANGNLVDYTGFEKFEGADFYFEHGVIRDDMDGLTLINGTWYNMQQGRFNTADGMVFFEGATFLVKGGVIDETQSGLIEYDGQRFVFSYGQFVSSLYGAWPDPISGRFVYIWAGQFYPITDLVSYDGQIFYFIDGYLATDFVGTVYDFNGTPFNVIYGQVY